MIERNIIYPPNVEDYYEHVMRPHELREAMSGNIQGLAEKIFADSEPLCSGATDGVFTVVESEAVADVEKFTLVEVDPEAGTATVVVEDFDVNQTLVEIDPQTESVTIVDFGETEQ